MSGLSISEGGASDLVGVHHPVMSAVMRRRTVGRAVELIRPRGEGSHCPRRNSCGPKDRKE